MQKPQQSVATGYDMARLTDLQCAQRRHNKQLEQIPYMRRELLRGSSSNTGSIHPYVASPQRCITQGVASKYEPTPTPLQLPLTSTLKPYQQYTWPLGIVQLPGERATHQLLYSSIHRGAAQPESSRSWRAATQRNRGYLRPVTQPHTPPGSMSVLAYVPNQVSLVAG